MINIDQWKNLESSEQLEKIIDSSDERTVAIFKHSTRCSISSMALDRLRRGWNEEEMEPVDFYYLDLISYRNISNEIADKLKVPHQSPQLIIIRNGKAVFHTSHMGVNYEELKNHLI